jgi:hypothetical protein
VAALAVLGSAACGSSSTSTPTIPTPAATTETFTGTLTQNGAETFPFVSTQAGSANLVVMAMDPDLTATMQTDGTGAFILGEGVFQGAATFADATTKGTVYSWNPATGVLTIKDIVGAFTTGLPVVGADSGAQWTPAVTQVPVLGIAMGTFSGTVCSIVLANDVATVGSAVTGQVQGPGSLCARVYDVGKIPVPATFTIDVTHF